MVNNQEHINRFKEAMANYPTGVSVVTTTDASGLPFGLTINSFASVSLSPTLVLWSIDNNVSTYEPFSKTEHYAINILGKEQHDIAMLFASKEEDRFDHCEWSMSAHDLPLIDGAIATLQCKLHKRIEAGDHLILIGEVISVATTDDAPLLYHGRKIAGLPESYHEDQA